MKKVLKIVVDVLAWIVLIVAFIITLLVFTSERNNGIPNLFGIMPMSVESDSMAPTFNKGDLIFIKEVDLYDIKVDDVITYYTIIQGQRVRNTHRVTQVNEFDNTRSFITKGDNNPVQDVEPAYASDIVGRWNNVKFAGMGNVLDFLRSRTGFFICIVIPMALFFLFELYKFIVALVESKKTKISKEDEEEIKRKAIEEYLAKEKGEEAPSEEVKEDVTGDGNKED
ncbi:MAG: signal peptidase I [Clostridiales bacterium]|nr:signal peptidase I [Clostridiales bacterium]